MEIMPLILRRNANFKISMKCLVIKIRDSYQGTLLFVTWDLEAKRIIEFLNKFSE